MPVSNDIQSLRVKYGYVNPGNTDLTMYIINWFLVISSAIVVGLVWTLYNKKEGITDVERKDMLFVGIIASILLFLLVVPINIARRFTTTISRHPVYFIYTCLSIFLIVFVAIYHDKVDSSEQRGYVIAILIILGLIILFSALMWWWTSHPYSSPLEILGDEDFYAINNRLYTKNRAESETIKNINKFISNKDNLTDLEWKQLQEFYNKSTPSNKRRLQGQAKALNSYSGNDKNLLEIQMKNYLSDLKKEKNKNIKLFYALARFKEGYDYKLSEGTETDEKKEALKNYINDFKRKSPIDFRKIYPTEPELIEQIQKEGILTPEQYNKYLGYYNPMAGGSAVGYVTKIETIKKEKDVLEDDFKRELENKESQIVFINEFNDLLRQKLLTAKVRPNSSLSFIKNDLNTKVNDYIKTLNDNKKLLNKDQAKNKAKDYLNSFTDCKDSNGNTIDFNSLIGLTSNDIPKINSALEDCLRTKNIP